MAPSFMAYEGHDECLRPQADGVRMLREEVTETDVADIVSKWSGIPVRCARCAHCARCAYYACDTVRE